jgi:hypothetical protein
MTTFKLQVIYGAISCQGWIGLLELEGFIMDGGMVDLDTGIADLDIGMVDLDTGMADLDIGMEEDQVISSDHKKDLFYPQYSK